jgi:hypothetical protein
MEDWKKHSLREKEEWLEKRSNSLQYWNKTFLYKINKEYDENDETKFVDMNQVDQVKTGPETDESFIICVTLYL